MGSGQSMSQAGAEGGPERFFDTVSVYADKPRSRSEAEETKYYGGNKLVVAARNEDWKQIKKLIEELDTPQPQVLIEVLIADLVMDDTRQLGAETRMPAKLPLPDGMAFQSASFASPPIVTPQPAPFPPEATIDSDLLATFQQAGPNNTKNNTNLANLAIPGSTLISFNDNDGSTWSLLEILQLFNNAKIISHPHVIAKHNTPALIIVGQQRVIAGNASGATGGTSAVNREKVDALLKVSLVPKITKGNIVNLNIEITINDYITAIPNADIANARTMRELKTNANVESGGIIALGGLTQTRTDRVNNEFPVLSKIPILGWFLKSHRDVVSKNNLTILITPTIIQPRLRGGLGDYTRDYIDHAKENSADNLFANIKDPITRFYFKAPTQTDDIIDEFTKRDEMLLPEYNNQTKKKEKNDTNEKILKKEDQKITTEDQDKKNNNHVPDLNSIVTHDDNNPFLL